MEKSPLRLKEKVSVSATAAEFAETEGKVEAEIDAWSQAATDYFKPTTLEVRDIVNTVAASVESLAERGQRSAGQFGGISKRLQEVAGLHNLQQMRQSLSESIRNVNSLIAQMVQEGQQSVASLRAQISSYQSRLQAAEALASRDPLTGLDNRCSVERHLDMLTLQSRAFSVILIDLNKFKPINEAIAFCDSSRRSCSLCTGRPIAWAGGAAKVRLNGAVGIPTWQRGESPAELIARADAAMYAEKSGGRS